MNGSTPFFEMDNTYKPVLELFDRLWPNRIKKLRRRKPHHKQAWRVALGTTTGLKKFLEEISPYLREKEPQALLCLEALDLPRGDPRKKDIGEELKQLKKE